MASGPIPVIDISAFCKKDASPEAKQRTAREIRQACEHVGFMYLRNFGISSAQVHDVFDASKHFFSQPEATKSQVSWESKEVGISRLLLKSDGRQANMGYVGIARERLDPSKGGDLKEAFNMKEPSRMKWPEAASPQLKEQLIAFYQSCRITCDHVLRAFALALDLEEEFFVQRHQKHQSSILRLLHYPPVHLSDEELQAKSSTRAGAHSDYGSITLLFQKDVGGLQVQSADGHWIEAPPISDTIVVNTGDLMMRWTNDLFKSTVHRVTVPHEQAKKQLDRYSIAFFCHPDDETRIECLTPSKAKYPPISALDYLLHRLQQSY